MLALEDDTAEFHARFARDPLLGPSARALVGYRPLRLATVAHAPLRAVVGQLIESRRARAIERSILAAARRAASQPARRSAGCRRSTCAGTGWRSTGRRRWPASSRASTSSGSAACPATQRAARLARERGIGPWSIGVVALEGLGRYDHGLVGDLGAREAGRVSVGTLARDVGDGALLEPYDGWRGLAGEVLLLGWSRGLVPGADADVARRTRLRTRRAA